VAAATAMEVVAVAAAGSGLLTCADVLVWISFSVEKNLVVSL
jgi:hypothetical protein